jgi:Arc/MetJ family transcription regulator
MQGDFMRMTLNIPEELIKEAQELLQFQSKTDVVILSLKELIRNRRIEELKNLAGQIDLKIDLKKQRKRA